MTRRNQGAFFCLLVAVLCPMASGQTSARGATFGTVIPIGGHAADIALDEQRGRLYVANFTANRIEVIDTASKTRVGSIQIPAGSGVSPHPATLALSPDGRYLVIGQFASSTPSLLPAVTIQDLQGGPTVICTDPFAGRTPSPPSPPHPSPLAIAFGSDGRALIAHGVGFDLLNPQGGCGGFLPLQATAIGSTDLLVPFATFPPEIIQASAGVSRNGNAIFVLAQAPGNPLASLIVKYQVALPPTLVVLGVVSDPDLGPVAVSVDREGISFLAGWALFKPRVSPGFPLMLAAQFPAATGRENLGSHAFDDSRNLIYANVPNDTETSGDPSTLPAPGQDAPVLTILDSDNLAVRERIRLRESLAGKSLLSSDRNVMYSLSDSGVTIFPVGSLNQTRRVTAVQEDVLFPSSATDSGLVIREIDVVDPGGGNTDFRLSTSALGVHIFPDSGVTPARVRIEVNPSLYQDRMGTSTAELRISSSAAINIPFPVRLLINTKAADQRGTILNVPGKLVDILADPVRNRFYVLRQDKNQVLVFDANTFQPISSLRTGNTPVQMAISRDGNSLLVSNDNSWLANLYDLRPNPPLPAGYIEFPPGHYPRSIAASNTAILATARVAGLCLPPLAWVHCVDQIVLGPAPGGVASQLPSLGIYENDISADSALAASPSGENIFMAMPDGTLALYEAAADTFVASRKDLGSISGAYGALNDRLFVADNNVVNWSLVPIAELDASAGFSSGMAFFEGTGLRTTSPSPSDPGVIQRVSLSTFTGVRPIRMAESPLLSKDLGTTPIGQIGQTILPLMRTLAVLSSGSIVSLTTSGFTVLPRDFDVVVPPPPGGSTDVPVVTGVVNLADGAGGIAPGGLVSISGTNFSSSSAAAGGFPLPSTLNDISVTVNARPVPLLAVSPSRIEAQLPTSIAGSASLRVANRAGVSSAFPITILPGAPAVFRTATAGPLTGFPTMYRATNNEVVTLTNPVHPRDTLMVYLTGLGVTSPAVGDGAAAPSDPLAVASLQPSLRIGGVPLAVLFAGLVPGMAGIYQINAVVPDAVPEGLDLPFTILQGSYATTLSVRVVR